MARTAFDSLNESQRRAATHIDGPLLVLAGPGSGKTRVVTHRIAHLISQGIPARQIVALSFTNKAADEMRRRVGELVGPQPVEMGTFHRFAARLLNDWAEERGRFWQVVPKEYARYLPVPMAAPAAAAAE